MNIKRLNACKSSKQGINSRIKDARQNEDYNYVSQTANELNEWIDGGREGVSYKEVTAFLGIRDFVPYKHSTANRDYWVLANSSTNAGIMFMHRGDIVYICEFVDDVYRLPSAMVGDSRRVKDAHQYSYGGTDWGGHYDEDFEMADEEYETAVDLMNGYMRLEEKNGIDWNRKIPVETWKNLFYDAMEMGLKADITDPNYIYDELEDANFHQLNWCLCISGVLGTDFQNEAIDYFTKVFANKKKGRGNDYSYSASDVRYQALWQIMQEMELV